MCLVCLMERISVKTEKGVEKLEEIKAYLCTNNYKNLLSTNPNKLFNKCFKKILKNFDEYNSNKSGWYFKEVLKLEIHTTEIASVNGSSYLPLPDFIKNKKAIVNIKNKDDKCFIWCILRYLYPRKHNDNRIKDLKKYEFSLNTKGISFPMDVVDINKFEKLNPHLPGINVFCLDGKDRIFPLREIKKKDYKNTIDLFLIQDDGKSHYTLIKDFHRLVRNEITKSNNGRLFICKRCFNHFT